MTTEKPPAPWWRVRTSSGTPPIQVPEAIVSAIASTITAAARTGSGRSAAKPSRIRGGSSAVDTAVLRRSREVGADKQPLSVPAVGGKAAVEAKDERGDAVGEPDRHDPERPARHEREPHQRDVVEGVAELARHDREVEPPEVRPAQEREALLA